MRKFTFYTDEIDTDYLDQKNPQMAAGVFAISNWKRKNFDECMYVMENAKNIGFVTMHDYHNLSVRIKITGEMSEEEYVLYRLKY